MKLVKGLGLLSFLTILSVSCFDPPEFPVVPEIEFESIEFVDSNDPSEFDSLILSLDFRDGDGNLGFHDGNVEISDPYHNAFYYQENNGQLQKLSTITGFPNSSSEQYDLLLIPNPNQGKLVVYRTRQNPVYSASLPQQYHCSSYEYLGGRAQPNSGSDGRRLLIERAARPALDPKVKIVDSIRNDNGVYAYYQIRDTLYYTPNPDHYNIEVDFLVADPAAPGGFKEFDWRKEYCTTFDGRFPVFSDNENSIDGKLTYSMTSLGFTTIFSIKRMKLRVHIKDRQLNSSNVIETPEFTLPGITRGG